MQILAQLILTIMQSSLSREPIMIENITFLAQIKKPLLSISKIMILEYQIKNKISIFKVQLNMKNQNLKKKNI